MRLALGLGLPYGSGVAFTPSFHPRQLPGLVALYDISDLSSLFEERTGASASTPASVDGVVGTVRDLSGNGLHYAAVSDAARPVLRQSGGLYYLEFDGVDDQMIALASHSVDGSEASEMHCGIELLNSASVTRFFGHGANSTQQMRYLGIRDPGGGLQFTSSLVDNDLDFGTIDTDPHIFWMAVPAGTGQIRSAQMDNESVLTIMASPNTGGTTLVLNRSLLSAAGPQLKVFYAAMFNRVLDPGERASMRTWGAGKSGVTL